MIPSQKLGMAIPTWENKPGISYLQGKRSAEPFTSGEKKSAGQGNSHDLSGTRKIP